MFDVRIVSDTGATYNYFDVSEQDITEWDNTLPEGWTMTVWFTPTEDDRYDGCNACYESERYDEHIHS